LRRARRRSRGDGEERWRPMRGALALYRGPFMEEITRGAEAPRRAPGDVHRAALEEPAGALKKPERWERPAFLRRQGRGFDPLREREASTRFFLRQALGMTGEPRRGAGRGEGVCAGSSGRGRGAGRGEGGPGRAGSMKRRRA